ncbi:MAG TPA: amidohydrolase family protein [Chloroflexota bacterium]
MPGRWARLLLAGACAALALLLTLRPEQPAAGAQEPASQPYQGPLVDSHAHLDASTPVSADLLLSLYDAVGVRGAWLFGAPWSQATDAWQRYPDRVVPFLAEPYAETLGPASSYRNPDGLDELFRGGYIRGLGEMILRHSAFRLGESVGGGAWPAVDVPADDSSLLAAYAVAGRYGAPVVVHQEAAYADELERAVRASPNTTFVWAHAGHGPASLARQLLARNPNLYADLAARTPWLGPGTVITRADGSLQPEWAVLLAEYPDRFLIGFDLFAVGHYRLAYLRDTVDYYRALLGRLDPATAEQIAHGNAERLAPFLGPVGAP